MRPLVPAGCASRRRRSSRLADVDQAEGRFARPRARLVFARWRRIIALSIPRKTPRSSRAALGVEEAGEALLLEPASLVAPSRMWCKSVSMSSVPRSPLLDFDQGHQVGRTALGLLVQLRPVDRASRLVGEHLREAQVIVREDGPDLGHREVEHADRPAVAPERHHDAGRDLRCFGTKLMNAS